MKILLPLLVLAWVSVGVTFASDETATGLAGARLATMVENPPALYTTIYVTKYALTRGILIEEAEVRPEGKVAITKDAVYRNSEFWYNMEDAIKRAQVLRTNKEKSIERQRQRLEGLRFQKHPNG